MQLPIKILTKSYAKGIKEVSVSRSWGAAWVGSITRSFGLAIRSDEGPTLALETSAFESLHGGRFTLSTQLVKPNYHMQTADEVSELAEL